MDDEKTPRNVGQDLVAAIVSSYVQHNMVAINDLPTVIALPQAQGALHRLRREGSVQPALRCPQVRAAAE
jgi:predicted transcriptional regulator